MRTDSPRSSRKTANPFIRVLRTDSFVEKVLLLILAAVLSGALIPLVIKSVDSAREGREAIASAQAKLFDDFSETLLTCETLMLDISWFGTKDAKNAQQQTKAFDRYTERSVDLIAKWRAQSSRAQALVSPDVAKKLEAFQQRFFAEQDTPMNQRWISCGTSCDWEGQHRKNHAMLNEANSLILELANDFGLTKNPAAAGQTPPQTEAR